MQGIQVASMEQLKCKRNDRKGLVENYCKLETCFHNLNREQLQKKPIACLDLDARGVLRTQTASIASLVASELLQVCCSIAFYFVCFSITLMIVLTSFWV